MSGAGARLARFAPPALGEGIVARDRLFDRLDRRGTTVVTGTAGYGKSSLVSSWLAARRPRGAVGWLTLTASDGDVGRFCADLLTALRSAAGEPIPGLRTLEAPPLLADPLQFIDAVLEALYETGVSVTLVLDDIQQLSGSERVLHVLDHVLQWAPASTRVILVGRTVPRLRLQRLRLDDRLELIAHRDLAFTPEETAAAVSALDIHLPAGDLQSLHDVTQGWPAAVRMAALAARAGGSDKLLVGLRHDDALADYLTTEVLSRLDEEIRSFVLVATIDELVCPSLVDAVRGEGHAGGMLERCVADGLFLTREATSGTEQWYRWHSLFAAQMRDRRWAGDVASARSGELRAAQWWRSIDGPTAFSHALHSGDTGLAGDIAASSWLSLVLTGRAETAVSLIDSLASEVPLSAEHHLAIAFVAAQSGRMDAAGVELAAARRVAHLLDEPAAVGFEIRATVIDLFLVNDRTALVDVVSSASGMLRDLRSGAGTSDPATVALVQLYAGMGHARLQDDLPGALRLLREAAESARVADLPALELAALAETCVPSIAEGHLETTALLADRLLEEARSRGWADLRSLAPAHGYLGWLALWQGDGVRARDLLERALSLLLPTDWGMRGLVLATLTQSRVLVGDLAGAEAAVREAHLLAATDRMPPWWPSLLSAVEAGLTMERGDLDRAVALAQAPQPGPGYNLADCLRGNVLLRGGQAQACLDLVQAVPGERRFAHVAVLIEVLSALALHELGREVDSRDALERALSAATPFALLTPFLMAGPGIAPLLQGHVRAGTAYPELVPRVLARIEGASHSAVNEWGETLTEREHAILRYLATNLSNAEIAEAEFISVNTTKTHIAHVYRKLGVSSRRTALRKAGELGLI